MTRLDEMGWSAKYRVLCLSVLAVVAPASCTVDPLPLRSDGAGEGVPSMDTGSADPGGPDGAIRVSFATDILPLLKRSCSCHVDGTNGPALDDYARVYSVADIGNRVIQEGSMPPWAPLSAADKTLFQSWIDAGKPNN